MRVLFASSEVYPLIKTGGLADVAGALPAALNQAGCDLRVLLPGYPEAAAKTLDKTDIGSLGDPLGIGGECRLIQGKLPDSDVIVWLLDCPALYDRAGGPYQDGGGFDYADNVLRFGMLSWAAAHLCTAGSPSLWRPEILHCHDWQTGLAPAYLQAWNVIDRPGTVFTIHNIAYQGQFPADSLARLGLPQSMFQMQGLEYWGDLCFLKAGLFYSDRLTTVSPRYAKEIQTQAFGCGMEGLLSWRAEHLTGILNGADYQVWDSKTDKALPVNYGPKDVKKGKAACKAALQAELGLDVQPDAPLLTVISRLTGQKGMDLLLTALPALLAKGVQLAVLGAGDRALEDGFRAAAAGSPGRIAATIGYSEQLAHRQLAAADMLVMPSRFEPCGLTQLYAMRYGTAPVVHAVGGLADSVVDAGYDALMTGTGTGFVFDHANAGAFQYCVERAVELYAQPDQWKRLQSAGVKADFSWSKSAARYVALYKETAR